MMIIVSTKCVLRQRSGPEWRLGHAQGYNLALNQVMRISCTVKCKPLVLSWWRTPRLDSDVRTADPTKVRVAERQRAEDEPRVLESTVGRVVPLLPIAPARASSELEAEDVAPLLPRRQRKKTAVAGGPSHPPKKLREDFGALGGVSTAGKSMAAVQSLFSEAMLEAEARGEPIPTLPFVTSSVSATPEREDRSPADSVTGPNLRTIGAPQRFVISSDSSHHFGANIAESKVDSIIRSSAPAIATVTTVTATIDTEATATRAPISLNAEVRMHAEYNIREKRKLRAVVDEQAELLKTKDGEIEILKAQLLLKEAEAAKAIRLQAEVFKFKSAEQCLRASVKVREQEVADLDAQVHELEISSAGLQEKVAAYEGFVSQLEKFQDEKLEEVNEKFDKLCADFVEMAPHLEEKFYPHLLTTISRRQWLLTYDIELVVAKCLNSTEYLSTLGAAISKAVEKGMQEGLSAGITHGAEGRQLVDVAACNPSAEANYFGDTIMNLLRLDDVLVERLGLTESQPHVDQLMNMRENIANHVSALRGVFVPLSEPLSATALEGMEGTSGFTPDVAATLFTTLVSASTIPPISTDDYEVAHVEGQGGARVDDETVTDDDMNLFVSN
nr:hypothetical protein [Tanacetum cinerariifolium]